MIKEVKKILLIISVTFFISVIILGIASLFFYPETEIDINALLSEQNVKDFSIDGDTVTSTSFDPFINLHLNNLLHIKTISFYIDHLSEENVNAEIFTINNSLPHWNSRRLPIKNGKNTICYPDISDNIAIDYIRLDLAENPDVSMDIKYITINEPILVMKNACGVAVILSFLVLLFYLTQLGEDNKIIIICIQKTKNFLKEYKFLIKPTMILFVIYSIGISSIIRANIKYIDDFRRIYNGCNEDWLFYQRYIEYYLSNLLNMGNHLIDFSPASQLLGCFTMAIAGSILLYVITDKRKYIFSQYLALIPFGLSPYYLECLSYKFEAPYYGISILFCIIPFLFYKKNSILYYIISTLSLLAMFNTYYAASGVYPMIVVLLMFVMWMQKKDNKTNLTFLRISVAAFISALGIYKFLIMKPVESWVSSSLPSLDKLLPTIVNNYRTYYSYVLSDFKTVWLYLIAILVAGFIIVVPFRTKRNKAISVMIAFLTIFFMVLLCWGLYPALESTSFTCRSMFGFGIFITLVAIFICIDRKPNFFKLVSAILGWNFFIFSLSYGNYLSIQKDYTDFRIHNVLNYLTNLDYYSDAENEIYIEVAGSIGFSPIINNIPSEDGEILKRLTPITFREQWIWGEFEFYHYYNLAGYSWQMGENKEIELTDFNLPCIDNTMYFDVYGDEENLLIKLK